jgi:hypothetical protein
MVLLDEIIQIFRGSEFRSRAAPVFAKDFPGRPMRWLIAIERDLTWQPALALKRPAEKRLGSRNIALGAEQEIDGLSLLVNGAIEISPAGLDFDAGLVDAPGHTSAACKAVPALLELRNVMLNPTHDRRVRERKATLGHHLREVSKAELEPQIPAHAEDNDLAVEMAALEKIINAQHPGSGPQQANSQPICPASAVRTRTR